MYYLLGYRLLNLGLHRKKLEKRAMNTFLLALDGDVDFHPPAVQLLVDRMKKNPLVGAACGRIHPIGNGENLFFIIGPGVIVNRKKLYSFHKSIFISLRINKGTTTKIREIRN